MATTFEQIKAKASRLVDDRGMLTDLGRGVDDVLDRARINADDTVYVEKSLPESEHDTVAIGSICDILSGRDDDLRGRWWDATPNQIRAWFKRHGVRY